MELILLLCGCDKSSQAKDIELAKELARQQHQEDKVALKTFDYDEAESLTGTEDIFFFLEAEPEDNQPSYLPGAIAIVVKARGGVDSLSRETDIPASDLSLASVDSESGASWNPRIMQAYRPAQSSTGKVA